VSIVVCVVNCNRTFYIASDRRAVTGGVVRDDFKKIVELRPRVYFAMTGLAEMGLVIRDQLERLRNSTVTELLSTADTVFQPGPIRMIIMIAGQREEGGFFIWQKNNRGQVLAPDITETHIVYSFACRSELSQRFETHFKCQLETGERIANAIADTIRYASTVDESISREHDLICVERGRAGESEPGDTARG